MKRRRESMQEEFARYFYWFFEVPLAAFVVGVCAYHVSK